MATLSLHFPIGEVTLAQRLRAMLATCETKVDCSAWAGDYMEFADQLSIGDQRELVNLSVSHFTVHGRV